VAAIAVNADLVDEEVRSAETDARDIGRGSARLNDDSHVLDASGELLAGSVGEVSAPAQPPAREREETVMTSPDEATVNRMHRHEPHHGSIAARLGWLRAGVLGANDGIISTAGLVIGVAAATSNSGQIATAGVAGLVAGAVSMALGEYVSVSTQRDTERALIEKERRELATMPEAEHAELAELLRGRGLSEATAQAAATELTERDALRAHLGFELGIDQEQLANPWAAAGSSALAFAAGAAIPLIAVILTPASLRILVTFTAAVVGLFATGFVSAHLGQSPKRAAVQRLVVGGALAMAVTFAVGYLFGVARG
jgi:VIT1/CCC1 family predicted Fe2+/Mn2+ transporter